MSEKLLTGPVDTQDQNQKFWTWYIINHLYGFQSPSWDQRPFCCLQNLSHQNLVCGRRKTGSTTQVWGTESSAKLIRKRKVFSIGTYLRGYHLGAAYPWYCNSKTVLSRKVKIYPLYSDSRLYYPRPRVSE